MKNSTIIWLLIIFFVIFPSSIGRIFLDLAGGLILFIVFISALITGVGWLTWKRLKSNIVSCSECGANYINKTNKCPICGSSNIKQTDRISNIPASSATIDITAEKSD